MSVELHRLDSTANTALPPMIDPVTIERRVEFTGGRVDVRRYSWSAPVEHAWVIDGQVCTINMAITPRPSPCQIGYLGIGRKDAAQVQGRTLMLLPGNCLFVKAATGQYRSLDCEFDLDLGEEVGGQAPWGAQLRNEAPVLHNHTIESYMLKMYREICDDKYGSEVAIESLAKLIRLEVIRHFSHDPEEDREPARGGLAPWQMKAVQARVYADAPAPGLTELAALCGISVRHLSREFKKVTGQAVGKYIEAATMDRAYHLLQETDTTIGEIAHTLGFANSASFAYAFRRFTGFRPSEIRKSSGKPILNRE